MKRTALVLAAHGSRREPAVNDTLRAWAEALQARTPFAPVVVGFHQGAPGFDEVLDRLDAEAAVVVPVMTSAGYFAGDLLPRQLARSARSPRMTVRVTAPLGEHPGMADLALRRVKKLAETHGFDPSQTALVVVGHGTRRNPNSRRATEELVARVRARGACGEVVAAFLDEPPAAETAVAGAHWANVLVIPFLIGAGRHAIRDLPRRLGMDVTNEGPPYVKRAGPRLVICDLPLGGDEDVVDLIADLAQAASAGGTRGPRRTLRLGTRGSRLALWQANHVAGMLRARGATVELVEIETTGDRQLDRPIDQLASAGPFTEEIEEALRAGAIDLAVHSLKDLPVEGSPGLMLAAILPRGDAGEALVSRRGCRLGELPRGAVVGASCARRAGQLRALRPDLNPRPIRGPVDARVGAVRSGAFDAAVLAVAGLERLGLEGEIAERFALEQFVPAPGQAALAVQVRGDDAEVRALAAALDDKATRVATTAELELLRVFQDEPDVALAAHATWDDALALHARLLARDGSWQRDVRVRGPDVANVVAEVVERLRQTVTA